MSQQILSVTQINEYIRDTMEDDRLLCNVAVRGEISNYKCYPSGHHYFTIKDDNSSLKCVMFKGQALRLRFRPDNGLKIIALGKISVYPRDGAYQLYCTAITPDGVGDLHLAYEQLKEKLQNAGLFDPAHKKQIPAFPNTIGIVTSSAGAAVHDILRIIKKRWPLARVRVFPVRVQGEEAPDEIVSAIEFANLHKLADVLIVGRGGGSIEDLWAFNDERVAYGIFRSQIPIISAVGHEPDFTISDFVADLRAATPSNGAELAVPDHEALRQQLDQYSSALVSVVSRQIEASERHLASVSASSVLRSPQQQIRQKELLLSSLRDKLASVQGQIISKGSNHYVSLVSKLDALSPLKVLSRGYSIVTAGDGSTVTSIEDIAPAECLHIRVSDGSFTATVKEIMNHEP